MNVQLASRLLLHGNESSLEIRTSYPLVCRATAHILSFSAILSRFLRNLNGFIAQAAVTSLVYELIDVDF